MRQDALGMKKGCFQIAQMSVNCVAVIAIDQGVFGLVADGA